jgi:DNA modification methylase
LINKSYEKDEIVYDPFVGSGTTALSALNLGRRYIGSEINEDYYKISLDRIKQMEEQGTLFA